MKLNYSWLTHPNHSTPVVTCLHYVCFTFVRFLFVNKTHAHNNCNGKTLADSFQLREAEGPIFKTMRLIQHEFCWLTFFCRGNWLLPKPGPFEPRYYILYQIHFLCVNWEEVCVRERKNPFREKYWVCKDKEKFLHNYKTVYRKSIKAWTDR